MALRARVFVAGLLLAVAGAAVGATRASLTLGENTAGIVVDSTVHKGFVTNLATGTVSVIDLDAMTVKNTIAVRAGVRRMLVNDALNRIYVICDTAPGFVTVIDTKTEQILADIPVGNNPRAVASDFQLGEIFVRNASSNTISVINTATNAVTATFAIPAGGGDLYVNTNLGKIYVLLIGSKSLAVYDETTHALLHTLPVGTGANSVNGNDGMNRALVNNLTDKTVTVIDTATDTVIATLPVGGGTSSNFAETNSIWGKAWLPNGADGTVSVIDLNANAVVATVPVGLAPTEAVVDAAGGDVYVVNQGSNTVSVLDANTNAVTATLPVGASPWRTLVTRVNNELLTLDTNGNNTTSPDTLTISDLKYTRADTLIAVEYYYAGFDHYFHTADNNEVNKLDAGIFGNNWNRTYQFWRVWSTPGAGRAPVCRFFSTGFDPKSSHFYTPIPSECAALQAGSVWIYEGTVYYVQLPDALGNCAAGTQPLYRTYNNGMGGAPNHRYMISRAVRDHMVALGWVAEGSGPDIVFACLPPLQ